MIPFDTSRLLTKFTVDPRTNCWRWHNTTTTGEPRRVWVADKGRHILPQRLLWDRFCPENQLDRNYSLKRTCQCACCVNPEHHQKVKRVNKKIVVHTPNEAARSRSLARALRLAVHTSWTLALATVLTTSFAGAQIDYSPQFTYGMRAHADRSEAIRYAEADARRSCEMIMLVEPNTRTFPGETILLRLKQVHNPYFDPPNRWRARVRAECDVFTTRQ